MIRQFVRQLPRQTYFFTSLLAVTVFCGAAHAQRIEPKGGDAIAATPRVQLTNDQLASRFLDQATAGATPEEIATLSAALAAHPQTAFADWLNAQYAKPVLDSDLSLTVLHGMYDNLTPATSFHRHPSEASAMRAGLMISDQNNELRRMVAYALSQIFVVSDQDNPLDNFPDGLCDWYDMLYKDAFTNFSTILTDVTYHPCMSDFLSSAGNAKAGYYNAASRPDENYAREVMQLFSIGLVQLNLDGSPKVDYAGRAIPTYTQPEITEVARVFTGLMYPMGTVMSGKKAKGENGQLVPAQGRVRIGRDTLDEKRHDTGSKTFLGVTLPAGQSAEKDIADTLQILCTHPNTAPFFARGMIQRLVTSNPSPAYVQRVSRVFVATKGDMKSVISAILLDPEARDLAYTLRDDYGKLREPFLRVTQLARAFHGKTQETQPYYFIAGGRIQPKLGQFPLSSPSVFNFYLPNYVPPGIFSQRNARATDASVLVVAPEFQIVNSNTALLTPNYLFDSIKNDLEKPVRKDGTFALDLTPQIALANNPAALVDNVDMLLAGGMMSDHSRKIIADALGRLTPSSDPAVLKERARLAVYLTMISPDYTVQK